MDFITVEPAHRPLLQPYLYSNPFGICDFSFANLFIWQEVYGARFAIHKEHLLIRARSAGGGAIYAFPLGRGDKKSVITDLKRRAESEGTPLKMGSVTEPMKQMLNEWFPNEITYSNPSDLCDYIYLSDDLIALKGKKYSSKRNHINKFVARYHGMFEYKPITNDILPHCVRLNELWRAERGDNYGDYNAVLRALDNWELLGLEGGALFIDGQISAFTAGQPNNAQTYDIIIEKARADIEGAYAYINNAFARSNCAGFTYINREEDMGVAELKKAKMSYYPHIRREKGIGAFSQ